MKTSAIVLSGMMLLTSLAAAANTPTSSVPQTARRGTPAPLADGARATTLPFGAAPNTAYEQAVTAYMNNVLIEARKHHAQSSSASPGRSSEESAAEPPSEAPHLPAVDVSDLPQVEAIMIGRRASARLITASGGLLVVGIHDETRYGTVTRIAATGVWLRPDGLSHPILLEDLTPGELAAQSGAHSAGAMGRYGNGVSIAMPPIPISPSRSRLPSGVKGK